MPTTPARRALRLAAVLGSVASLAAVLGKVRRGAGIGTSEVAEIGGDTWPPVPVNTGQRS